MSFCLPESDYSQYCRDLSALGIQQNQTEDIRGQEKKYFYDSLLHKALQIWLSGLPYSTFLNEGNDLLFKLTHHEH